MAKVICFIPIEGGNQVNQEAWGIYRKGKELAALHSASLIGIAIHSGLGVKQLEALPFDELYHMKLKKGNWPLADARLRASENIIKDLSTGDSIFLFSSNPVDHEIAVRLSYRNQAMIVTNVMDVQNTHDGLIVQKSLYGDVAHEWLKVNKQHNVFITFNEASLYGKIAKGNAARLIELPPLYNETGKVSFIDEFILSLEDLKLTEARCVIGIGRGVSGYEYESLELISELSELLNAPIGGSKVADELKLIPREQRIGSSGQNIEADIYIAIGISGSSQHLAGIGDVKHVIAINSDAAAPIFNRCEIGIISDFREGVKLLLEALKTERKVKKNA